MKRFALLLVSLLALLLTACQKGPAEFNGKNITGVMEDLSFELIGEQGETVTAERFQGKAVVMFFGYTHCPDFCPTTLSSLSQAMEQLSAEQREQLRILFISVDPKRDTPALLKQYTDYFGPEVVGLTGEKKNLNDITKRYRTAYGYGEEDDNGNYNVSHGLAMYGFDRAGKVRLLMRNSQPVDDIAQDLKTLLDI